MIAKQSREGWFPKPRYCRISPPNHPSASRYPGMNLFIPPYSGHRAVADCAFSICKACVVSNDVDRGLKLLV